MKKVIGYLRVSTEPQDDKRQSDLIQEYCSKNNFEIVKLIREKASGAKSDRAGRAELMTLNNEDGDLVIFSETSRLSREEDIMKLLNNVNDLLENGLDVLFLDGEKSFKSGKVLTLFEIMQLAFEAAANSDERKKFIVRAKSGKISKLKQGCFTGHKVAYSYKVVPNPLRVKDNKEFGKSLYVVDETGRQTVETIFDLIGNQNYTLRGTAKELNSLGLLKNKVKWNLTSINHVISNPLYYGDYSFSGEIGKIEGIVTKELFDKAHIQLKSNHLFKNKGTTHYNVLKGLFACPCGGNFMLTTRGTNQNYYRCIRKHADYINHICNNFGIQAEFLTSIIWQLTQSYINRSDFELKTIEATKTLNNVIALKDKQVTKLLQEQDTLKNSIETAVNSMMVITNATALNMMNDKINLLIESQTELTNRISKLNKELLKLRLEVDNYSIKNHSKLIDSISDEEKNTIYRKYISKIIYYSFTQTRGTIHVLFNNGFEAVVMTSTRRMKHAYELPQSFSFNPIRRKVITKSERFESTDYKVDGFVFPTTEIIEKNYDEVVLSLNMNEYEMIL